MIGIGLIVVQKSRLAFAFGSVISTGHLAADCLLLPDELSSIFRGDGLLGESRGGEGENKD